MRNCLPVLPAKPSMTETDYFIGWNIGGLSIVSSSSATGASSAGGGSAFSGTDSFGAVIVFERFAGAAFDVFLVLGAGFAAGFAGWRLVCFGFLVSVFASGLGLGLAVAEAARGDLRTAAAVWETKSLAEAGKPRDRIAWNI